MSTFTYLDFDLCIEQAEQGLRAKVLESPAGQASVDFTLPFSDLELENFLLRLGGTTRTVRGAGSSAMDAAQTFGGKLFEAVFDGEVRGCLRSSLDEAKQRGMGLRIRLRLGDAPRLADIPWEYLYNPALARFLALSSKTPLIRFLDLPEPIISLAVTPPLRMLVLISGPTDFPPLDVEREWQNVKAALGELEQQGLITVERLETATFSALQRQLWKGQYHIFHFIGHGEFDERTQDGTLLLEDDQGRGRRVTGQQLGTLLHDHDTLRLAVLNACEGARTSINDPFAGAAQSLVRQGIPAVIAMQFAVSDNVAISLAQEFYTALAHQLPVDAALAAARKAIFAQSPGVEWGTPVLYLRTPDGVIFDLQPRPATSEAAPQVSAWAAITSRLPQGATAAWRKLARLKLPTLPFKHGGWLELSIGVITLFAFLGVLLGSPGLGLLRSLIPQSKPVAQCRVIAAGLNLRLGPGIAYQPPITALTRNTLLTPIARQAETEWIKVQVPDLELVGWVNGAQTLVKCTGELGRLPIAEAPPIPTAPAAAAEAPVPGAGGDQPMPTDAPCVDAPRQRFGKLYSDDVGVRVKLGCPISAEVAGFAVDQFYAGGTIYWWADTDTIYAFLGTSSGSYHTFSRAATAALPPPPSPTSNLAPILGFGRIYSGVPEVRDALGAVQSVEFPIGGAMQRFQNGLMLYSPPHDEYGSLIFVLYEDGTFARYDDTFTQ